MPSTESQGPEAPNRSETSPAASAVILIHLQRDFAGESVPLAIATRELLERYSHAKHVKLLVDFQGIRQLSSEAIGNLIILNRNLRNRRGIVKLCGLEPELWNLFLNARLNRVFEIYDTQANALHSFTRK
jgi:anti-anti-sigma factor